MKQVNWKELFLEAGVSKPIYYTVSGSHLYGFSSPDSDRDYRGCHCAELPEVLGLNTTKEVREYQKGEVDFVSFDLRKELNLVLANNSNVLEHLAATPLYKSKYYPRLKTIAEKSLSKIVAKPYWGMHMANLHKYLHTFNESYRQAPVKKYLYVIRGLMAGIYALEKHRIEPNLKKLNEMRMFQIPVVDTLIEMKVHGKEKDLMAGYPQAEEAIKFLQKRFKEAEEITTLNPTPMGVFEEANDFLLEVRMK